MSTSKQKNPKYKNQARGQKFLYDARGTRVKSGPLSNKYLRLLLFWILPYIVINGIILLLVCSTPKISIDVGETDDYVTTEVTFNVRSVLPLKELKVTMESADIPFEKTGSGYKCTVSQNGTICVEAKSLNGMQRSDFADIGMLDDTAPYLDDSSVELSNGKLSFLVSDSQSGVDFNAIYGIVDGDATIRPSSCDKSQGRVTMEVPQDAGEIELNYSDMVGNAASDRVTINVTRVLVDEDGNETVMESEEAEVEENDEESDADEESETKAD